MGQLKRRFYILGLSLLVLVIALAGLFSVLESLSNKTNPTQGAVNNNPPTTTPTVSDNTPAVSNPVNLTPDINPSSNFSISLPKNFNFDTSKAVTPDLSLNGANPPHMPILKVTGAEHTAYLKSLVSTFYDGKSWVTDISGMQKYSGETLALPVLKSSQSVTDTVKVDTVANIASGNEALPTSLYPVSVNSAQPLMYSPEDMTFLSQNDFPKEYSFQTTHFSFSTQTLAKAQTDPSAPYSQLPESITTRTYQLAKDITGGITSPFLQAKAIEDYLKTNYTYDFNAEPAPAGTEPNDWFLFTEKRGVCTNFNSSFTVLARAVGLPARMAGGFYIDPQAGEQTVYADQAHAWAEVKFKDLGWYTFDATGSPDGGKVTEQTPTVTNITTIDTVAAKGDTFNVSGTVLTNGRQPVEGALVEILVNTTKTTDGAKVVGQGIASQGKFKIQAVIPGEMAVGNYQVIAHTQASTQYAESFSDPAIKVVSDSAIKLSAPVKIKAGDTITINGLLSGKFGEPLANQTLGVAVGSQGLPSVLTDSTGHFAWKRNWGEPGVYTIKFYFAGTEFFRATMQTADFRVLAPAILSIKTNGDTVNKPVTVSGILEEQITNLPLDGHNLSVTIDSKALDIKPVTAKDGKYEFKYTFNTPGSHDITVNFAGDEDYYETSAATGIVINAAAAFNVWPIIIAVLVLAAAGAGGWLLYKWLKNRPATTPVAKQTESAPTQELQPQQISSGGITLSIELPQIKPPFPDVWGVNEELKIGFGLVGENGAIDGSFNAEINGENIAGAVAGAEISRMFKTKGQYNITAEYTDKDGSSKASATRPVRVVDYREEIVALFNKMKEDFRAKGIPIGEDDTPRKIEYLVLNAGAWAPEKAMDDAVATFEEADYSLHPITRRHYETMYLAQTETKKYGKRNATD